MFNKYSIYHIWQNIPPSFINQIPRISSTPMSSLFSNFVNQINYNNNLLTLDQLLAEIHEVNDGELLPSSKRY